MCSFKLYFLIKSLINKNCFYFPWKKLAIFVIDEFVNIQWWDDCSVTVAENQFESWSKQQLKDFKLFSGQSIALFDITAKNSSLN